MMKIKLVSFASAILATVAATTAAQAQDTTSTDPLMPPGTSTTMSPGTSAPAPTTTTTQVGGATSTTTVTQAPVEPTPMPVSDYRADVVTKRSTLPNRPLMLTGGLLGIATYVPSAIVAGTSDRDEDKYLFIPVVGPWIDLGNRDYDARGSGNKGLDTAMLIGSGALQGVAAVAIITSLIVPESRTTVSTASTKPTFSLAPTQIGRTGYGMGAVGTF